MSSNQELFEKNVSRIIIQFEHDNVPREMQVSKKSNGLKVFKYKMNFGTSVGKSQSKPNVYKY